MGHKSIKKNALLNVLRQTCNIIFPMITFPYVLGKLGVDNYGKVNFAASIVSYVSLIAAMGIESYAIREGSRIRENPKRLNAFCSQILSINVCSTIVSILGLMILITASSKLKAYQSLLMILSLQVIFVTIGTNWVNSIFEDYLYISIRTIIARTISTVCIFLFVRTEDDYQIYAFLVTMPYIISNILNYYHVRKYVSFHLFDFHNVKRHLNSILILFAVSVSVTIYVSSDVTMIGYFLSDYEVGLYSSAAKIYNIIKTMLNALIMVVLPRLSVLLAKRDKDGYDRLCNHTIESLICLVIPTITGLYMMSDDLFLFVGGGMYLEAAPTLRVLCFAMAGAVFGCFYMNAIIIANQKEKVYMFAAGISAAVNILLNLFAIPLIGFIGAAYTTIIAEFIVLGIGIVKSKGLVSYDTGLMATAIKTACGSAIIVLVFYLARGVVCNPLLKTGLSVLIGAGLYVLLEVLLKNDFWIRMLLEFKQICGKIMHKSL